ncbi:hypothetical protein CTAYLR_001573 [Chrysophaeum taylorii]|uniref:Peptidase M11 gametolysin domain-containing protein n=1 Tax=Chrysophaeum taylorii TaxID=2483200 RepID=A0AAD7UF78_9STRA|nr:hypothetical protein CTAYLR_001573 [Chrysophaeum taylorii]
MIGRDLVGSTASIHEAVVRATLSGNASTLAEACAERRSVLEALVEQRRYEELADVSFALEAPCEDDDEPYVGFANVAVRMESDRDRTSSSRRLATASINGRRFQMLTTAARLKLTARGVPVVGVVLGGTRFVALDAPMRCESGRIVSCHDASGKWRHFESLKHASEASREMIRTAERRAKLSRLADIETNHVAGIKSILFIPICPSDSDCDEAYDYGLIASDYGGDLEQYLIAVVALCNDYLEASSWGTVSLEATYLPIQQVEYTQADCASGDSITHLVDESASSYDNMAFDAAEAAGASVGAYDYNVVVIPKCASLTWSGVGWVGYAGTALNLFATSLDPSLAHELGHNFGANHASFANADDGSRGAVAWWSEASSTWVEYANPFSVMGAGILSTDDYSAQFLVEGKIIFDWVGVCNVQVVAPFDDDTGASLCNPCGPYHLQATDDGTLDPAIPVAIQVETSTRDRYLFVEYRESSGGAVLTWSDVYLTAYGTGAYGNTVIADTTPETESLGDAVLVPGRSYEVDLGLESIQGERLVSVSVEQHNSGRLLVTVTPAASSSSLAPTTAFATAEPTSDDDRCGEPCCAFVEIYGVTYTKLTTGTSGACCSGTCSYVSDAGVYLHYLELYDEYFASSQMPCHTSGTLIYTFRESKSAVAEYCDATPPSCPGATPVPSAVPTTPTRAPSRPTACPSSRSPSTHAPTIAKISFVAGNLEFSGLSSIQAANFSSVFASAVALVADYGDAQSVAITTASPTRRRLLSSSENIQVRYSISLESISAESVAGRLNNATLSDFDRALAVALTNRSQRTRLVFDDVSTSSASSATIIAATAVPTAVPSSLPTSQPNKAAGPTPVAPPTPLDDEESSSSSSSSTRRIFVVVFVAASSCVAGAALAAAAWWRHVVHRASKVHDSKVHANDREVQVRPPNK